MIETKIELSKPFMGEEEIRAVSKVIKSGWITSGKVGEEFEAMFAELVGAKYAVFLNSCTSALDLSVKWYKKKYQIEKVLVPSLTFVATAQVVVHNGLTPLFGDVGRDCLLSENNSSYKYDLAIPVHLFGKKAKTEWDSPCIEDSAHLIEKNQCKDNPNTCCFSFYASKNISCSEGGMIATNDKDFYLWLKQARHHGIIKDGWGYDAEFNGWKANQSDILAAIGIEQLKKFDKIQAERKRCVDIYNQILRCQNTGLHLYPIIVDDRKLFIKKLEESGVSCGVHYLPVHKMSAFKEFNKIELLNTEYFGERLVSLPLYPELTDEEIHNICIEVMRTELII